MYKIGILVAVLLLVVLVYKFTYKETFDPNFLYSSELVSRDSDQDKEGVLSNGTVQKYFEDGIYNYNVFFNIPTVGSIFQTNNLDTSFNDPGVIEPYKVYAGSSKKDLEFIDVLPKIGNGNHELVFTSKKDYKIVCVKLGNSFVECVEF